MQRIPASLMLLVLATALACGDTVAELSNSPDGSASNAEAGGGADGGDPGESHDGGADSTSPADDAAHARDAGAEESGADSGVIGSDAGPGAGLKFDHLVVILMEHHNLPEIYG